MSQYAARLFSKQSQNDGTPNTRLTKRISMLDQASSATLNEGRGR